MFGNFIKQNFLHKLEFVIIRTRILMNTMNQTEYKQFVNILYIFQKNKIF